MIDTLVHRSIQLVRDYNHNLVSNILQKSHCNKKHDDNGSYHHQGIQTFSGHNDIVDCKHVDRCRQYQNIYKKAENSNLDEYRAEF
ncbi:hypothetical protein NitYY0810_C1488 [Nitratiruptor sp. YY08-10]|nr:hypothetical protein NitYY0810_C1488 [Nitratiruptor sp. YY08-10]